MLHCHLMLFSHTQNSEGDRRTKLGPCASKLSYNELLKNICWFHLFYFRYLMSMNICFSCTHWTTTMNFSFAQLTCYNRIGFHRRYFCVMTMINHNINFSLLFNLCVMNSFCFRSHHTPLKFWHECQDLNPDEQFWRLSCYRYITLVIGSPTGSRNRNR